MAAIQREPTGAYPAVVPVTLADGTIAYATAMVMVDATGNTSPAGTQANPSITAGKQETFTLADAKSAAGDYPNGTPSGTITGQAVYGGDYIWTVVGTLGSGGSAALKVVIRNSANAVIGTQTLATKTTADTMGGSGIGLGSNAEVYVTLAGTALSGVTVQISRQP